MKAVPVDAANHEHFNQIRLGTKELLTRHNRQYHDGMFYKDLKASDLLEVIDKRTKASVIVEITEARYFHNLDELFKSKLADRSFDKVFKSKRELSDEYEKNRPGYSVLLERDGIVVWKIRIVVACQAQ